MKLEQVLAKTENLCACGYDDRQHTREEFQRCRSTFVSQYEKQYETCLAWLKKAPKTKTRFSRNNSYGLKHVIERLACQYTPNGAIIAAAIALKIRMRSTDGINAGLGIAQSWVNAEYKKRDVLIKEKGVQY
jgi:hypothetical protein